MKRRIELTVNGDLHRVEVPVHRTLLDFLKNDLELMGTRSGCETGDCGCCTVLLDGKAVVSCLVLAVETHGRQVLTVEGLARNGDLHPLQEAFIEHGAVQCGYCTPGMLLSAKALLDEIPRPTEEEVKEGLAGNLCRCTGYYPIVRAVMAAAEKLAPGGGASK
jgi:carbon-monoxide dehydrogenase small subunit